MKGLPYNPEALNIATVVMFEKNQDSYHRFKIGSRNIIWVNSFSFQIKSYSS